jgi:hypothetical protein
MSREVSARAESHHDQRFRNRADPDKRGCAGFKAPSVGPALLSLDALPVDGFGIGCNAELPTRGIDTCVPLPRALGVVAAEANHDRNVEELKGDWHEFSYQQGVEHGAPIFLVHLEPSSP